MMGRESVFSLTFSTGTLGPSRVPVFLGIDWLWMAIFESR